VNASVLIYHDGTFGDNGDDGQLIRSLKLTFAGQVGKGAFLMPILVPIEEKFLRADLDKISYLFSIISSIVFL
jgi:hypothetical protein